MTVRTLAGRGNRVKAGGVTQLREEEEEREREVCVHAHALCLSYKTLALYI